MAGGKRVHESRKKRLMNNIKLYACRVERKDQDTQINNNVDGEDYKRM